MHKVSKYSLLFIVAIWLGAIALCARPPRRAPAVPRSDIQKAEYVFLEAEIAAEDGRYDDAYMLHRHARHLNPADTFISAALAEMNLRMPNVDSTTESNAYKALQNRFLSMPTDDYYANVYIYFAGQAGNIDDIIAAYEMIDSLQPSRTDPAMNLADALVKRYNKKRNIADLNRAIDIYNRQEAAVGINYPITLKKVIAYAVNSDTMAILRQVNALALSAPGDANTNLVVGRLYEGLNYQDSAIYYYERSREISPDDGIGNLTRAKYYYAHGDSVAFDREVFAAMKSPRIPFQSKMEMLTDYVTTLYADSLQHGRIEQMFETMQDVNPGEADLHALYGAYKATIGQYDTAAEQFSYSIDLNPENEGVWSNLMQVYIDNGEIDNALVTARRALALFPGDFRFTTIGAAALMNKEQYGRALALLDSVDYNTLPHPEAASHIFATKGDIYYKLGQPDSAIIAYTKAIELNPDNFMALNNCAYYMAENDGNLDLALTYASIAVKAEPDNDTYLDTQAWVFFKRKEYAKAREVIDKALKIYNIPLTEPKEIKVDSEGVADVGAMVETIEEETMQPHGEILDHAGDIYFMTGDHKQALVFWKKALKDMPDNALLRKKVEHKTIFFE